MKLTQEIIDQIQEAMLHTKKDGTVNWKDTDEIVVQLAGTFAADRFIVIKNRTKDPVVSAANVPARQTSISSPSCQFTSPFFLV